MVSWLVCRCLAQRSTHGLPTEHIQHTLLPVVRVCTFLHGPHSAATFSRMGLTQLQAPCAAGLKEMLLSLSAWLQSSLQVQVMTST